MSRAGALTCWLLMLSCHVALAHPAYEGATGFCGGLLHPLLVPAHALAVSGAGLLVGLQPARRRLPAVAAFAAALALGFGAMMLAFAPQTAGLVLLAATVLCGALAALARPVPVVPGGALALVAGAALALDSPPSGISVAVANITLLGTFCGALVLLAAVAGLTAKLAHGWRRLGVRILGSWIAAVALMALAARLAR